MNEAFVEVGGQCGSYFRRNIIFPVSQFNASILQILGKTGGRDAYYCTYLFDRRDRGEGTKFLSPLYFDIDGDITTDEGFEKLRIAVLSLATRLCMELRMETKELKFYFSGSKGFHVFVGSKVLGIKPYEKLNLVYKAFVQSFAKLVEHGELIDTKIYDNKRLIRIPNSINGKTGLYKIPIRYEELRTITRQQLLERARSRQDDYPSSTVFNQAAAARFREYIMKHQPVQASRIRRKIPEVRQDLPICMRYMLSTQVDKGGRNDYAAMLASVLIQNGYGDTTLEILEAWNSNNAEPLPEEELRQAYKSMLKLAGSGRGYGCSSIREKGAFPPRQVCPQCRIYKSLQNKE